MQVLKRGVFFPARANKLYELWKSHDSLDDIDEVARGHEQRDELDDHRHIGDGVDESGLAGATAPRAARSPAPTGWRTAA